MKRYFKNIAQLILAPSKGWEDISAAVENPERVTVDGYYPLIAIVALSEFLRYFYDRHASFVGVLMTALALLATFFISYYVGRLVLESLLKDVVVGEINTDKLSLFILYNLGLMAIIELIENCLPTTLTPVKFLPLFVALIVYKASAYMAVKPDNELKFLVICSAVVIVMPLLILWLLSGLIA